MCHFLTSRLGTGLSRLCPGHFIKKHGGCHSRVYKAMRECVGQASKTATNSYGGSQLFASPHIAFAQKLQLGINNKYRPQRNRRIVNALVCLLNGYWDTCTFCLKMCDKPALIMPISCNDGGEICEKLLNIGALDTFRVVARRCTDNIKTSDFCVVPEMQIS